MSRRAIPAWPVAARAFVAVLFGALAVLGAPAQADDADATIDHAEVTDGSLAMLVSLPGETAIDLDSVTVMIGEQAVPAKATLASTSPISRTAVLAIDTSNSMRGDRIAGAVTAATAFLDSVPADVKVGIVTFDNAVQVRQTPSVDRDASRQVLADLPLARETQLFAGVRQAIDVAGSTDGQHQVLLLSDGEDTSKTPLEPLLGDLSKAGTKLDVVALDLDEAATRTMSAMAEATGGSVIPSGSPAELRGIFEGEADALSRQVLITAELPAGLAAEHANAAVTLTADGKQHTATAFVKVATAASAAAPTAAVVAPDHGLLTLPTWVLYAGIGAFALAAVGLIAYFATSQGETLSSTVSGQLGAYGTRQGTAQEAHKALQLGNISGQARAAAQRALAANKTVESALERRLEGAAVAFKAPEWLLLHIGIAFGAALVGLLIGRGNPVVALIFLGLGGGVPWVYLGRRHAKRLKAFDASLADTLQLMSGSLSAGLSLQQSMDAIVAEGSEPTSSEFKRVIVETRLGVPIEDALEALADRMESKDFAWVVMAIRIQREVGGNLAELLLTVANTIREREYLRRHVRALSAEGRLSAWILGGLPPVFLLYLTLVRPAYVNPLYTTPIGWLMLTAMAVMLGVGVIWMSKVSKVEL